MQFLLFLSARLFPPNENKALRWISTQIISMRALKFEIENVFEHAQYMSKQAITSFPSMRSIVKKSRNGFYFFDQKIALGKIGLSKYRKTVNTNRSSRKVIKQWKLVSTFLRWRIDLPIKTHETVNTNRSSRKVIKQWKLVSVFLRRRINLKFTRACGNDLSGNPP